MALQAASSMAPSSPETLHLSPWHSPVPYLFGGLAATLSLISFALLILACSYFKHTDDDANGSDIEQGIETGDSKPNNIDKEHSPPDFKQKYLVVMAGQANPTFLATPVLSNMSSFGTCSSGSNLSENSSKLEVENMENENERGGKVSSMGNQETTNQRCPYIKS